MAEVRPAVFIEASNLAITHGVFDVEVFGYLSGSHNLQNGVSVRVVVCVAALNHKGCDLDADSPPRMLAYVASSGMQAAK